MAAKKIAWSLRVALRLVVVVVVVRRGRRVCVQVKGGGLKAQRSGFAWRTEQRL